MISDSEDNARALLRFLSDTWDIRACVVEEGLDGGLFVARFQADYDVDGAEPGENAPIQVLMYDEEGVKAYNPIPVTPDSDSAPSVGWLAEDSFAVYYHEFDHSKASPMVTRIPFGVETATLTYEQLGFFKPGRLFLGWRAYREKSQCWLTRDAEDNSFWEWSLSSDREYKLYTNRVKLKEIVPGGETVHLYAQWEDTDAFTVYYHPTAKDADNSDFTNVTYGTPTVTKSHVDLGYMQPGKRFLGWRVYRTDTRQWLVETDSKESKWVGKLPKGGRYLLFGDEAVVSDLVPAGARVHFYAEWGDADEYTILYFSDDYAGASDSVTKVKYDVATPTLSVEELGFSAGKGTFAGWKVYSKKENKWLVADPDGHVSWAMSPPNGWSYKLYGDGETVSQLTLPGYYVNFYAQWENAEQYTIVYVSDTPDYQVSDRRTYASFNEETPTLTARENGITRDGYTITGWRVYRPSNQTWLCVDADGIRHWLKKAPEDTSTDTIRDGKAVAEPEPGDTPYYYLREGEAVTELVPSGETVHLVADWASATYTVYYHVDDEAEASELTTTVNYGERTPTLRIQQLGFTQRRKTFAGWKVYYADTGEWRVLDPKGNELWAEGLPKDWQYCIYDNGVEVSKLAAPGSAIHFYAQWEKDKRP